jgi:hypothetical protein
VTLAPVPLARWPPGGDRDLLRVKLAPASFGGAIDGDRRGEWPGCAALRSSRVEPLTCEASGVAVLRRPHRCVAEAQPPDVRRRDAGVTREAVSATFVSRPSRCHWNEERGRTPSAMR